MAAQSITHLSDTQVHSNDIPVRKEGIPYTVPGSPCLGHSGQYSGRRNCSQQTPQSDSLLDRHRKTGKNYKQQSRRIFPESTGAVLDSACNRCGEAFRVQHSTKDYRRGSSNYFQNIVSRSVWGTKIGKSSINAIIGVLRLEMDKCKRP